MQGKILILGGAGFLGRGILRKAKKEKWDASFTIFSRDELKQHLCRDAYPQASYFLGDIRDADRLSLIMRGHDIVIHAAALKYVPESESNVEECIGINIGGTQVVARAAAQARVKTVVFISTDKAVEPANTYGLTKALGEAVMREASWMIPTVKFVTCRYGNVIGSTGSVLPVFRHQMETQGHVNVTNPDMTRFWLGIDDAVKIVEITAMKPTGTISVHVPRSLSIGAIADAVSGGKMNILGARPGEKLHEKLLTPLEIAKSKYDTIFDMSMHTYDPNQKASVIMDNVALTSDNVTKMEVETFLKLASDAELV